MKKQTKKACAIALSLFMTMSTLAAEGVMSKADTVVAPASDEALISSAVLVSDEALTSDGTLLSDETLISNEATMESFDNEDTLVETIITDTATTVSIDYYDFNFTDVRTNQSVRFKGNDGKAAVLVYGGISSCGNTTGAINTLNQLIDGINANDLEVYIVDIAGNTASKMNSFLSDKGVSSRLHIGSTDSSISGSGSTNLSGIRNRCRSALNISSTTMPLLLYKNKSGQVYDYSTAASDGGREIKSKLAAAGVEVNTTNGGTISDYVMNVKFGQDEARSQLSMINSFRTSSTEAWHYDSQENKIYDTGLSTLSYDYTLEKVAMLRAVEIAYSYSHTRANGDSFTSAYADCGYSTTSYGENIAYGYNSSNSVFEAWKETNEAYANQGHRRNMLSRNFSTFAVGHVVYNGMHFWVQEFGNNKQNLTATPSKNSDESVTIKVSSKTQKNEFGNNAGSNSTGNTCSIWNHSSPVITKSTVKDLGNGYHSGEEEGHCLDCCATWKSTVKEAHKYDSGVVVKPATTTEEGIRKYTCIKCNYEVTTSIAKLKETPSPSPVVNPSPVVSPTPVVNPTSTPVSNPDSAEVSGFVSRLYTLVLNRPAEEQGLKDWTSKLVNKEQTGAEVARGFFMSEEMTNRGLSNDEYVKVCYRTMLNREADEGGLNDWVGKLNNGVSRLRVLAGFTDSVEFGQICASYGISRGELTPTLGIDRSGAENFVARCYTKALGREAEKQGLNDWTNRIVNKEWTAESVASDGFFHSLEFVNKKTSDDEYVDILYRTFLGREADAAGKSDWVGKLKKGTSRDTVMYGFSRSVEFANIMAQYGL